MIIIENRQDTEMIYIENKPVKSRSSRKNKKHRAKLFLKRLQQIKGGYKTNNHTAHKFQYGKKSLVSGNKKKGHDKTCMPDACYNGAVALKQQDKTTPFLSIDESRSTLPFNDSAPNILGAMNYLKGKNFNL